MCKVRKGKVENNMKAKSSKLIETVVVEPMGANERVFIENFIEDLDLLSDYEDYNDKVTTIYQLDNEDKNLLIELYKKLETIITHLGEED